MRIRTTAIAALSTAALLTLTGCFSEQSVDTKPKPASSKAADSDAAKADDDAKDKAPKPDKNASIGDTLAVTGFQEGEKLDVTLKKWVDPAEPADEYDGPQKGKRWVAGQFEIVNTGSKVYDDTPSNGTQIADADGQRFEAWFADITAGPQMSSSVKLPKGEKALGWIVFEVPKDSKIASVQFTMNSGMADETGQWKID